MRIPGTFRRRPLPWACSAALLLHVVASGLPDRLWSAALEASTSSAEQRQPAQNEAPPSLRVHETPFGTSVLIREGDGSEGPVIELPFGSVLLSAIWGQEEIPVCWENPGDVKAAYRQLTRDAIRDTWAAVSKLRFMKWDTCDTDSLGIRIRVADEGPHVKVLGRYLDGRPNGMILNFTFQHWSPKCQKSPERCAKAIAAHEFGHAIGFAHEQNRTDAPWECQAEAQGTTGTWNVTKYDPNSLMNYCYSGWINGQLSARDVEAVTTIYGRRR
jgi:hypothetical protein